MHTKIYVTSNAFGVETTRQQMLAEGFHPLKSFDSAHIYLAGAEQGFVIEVPHDEVRAARTWLRDAGLAAGILPDAEAVQLNTLGQWIAARWRRLTGGRSKGER